MENRVGKNVPTDTEFAALEKRLEDLLSDLRKFTITLTKEERTSRIRPYKGFEEMAKLISDLSTRYGVTLADAPLTELATDLNLSTRTARLETLAAAVQQALSDTSRQATHEYAQAAFLHYGVLSSLAPHKPELAAALRPVKAFLSPPKKVAATPPTPDEPPAK